MYTVTTLATAVSQFTGEPLDRARRRIAGMDSWGVLTPAADLQQATVESVLLGTLGASSRGVLPFGVTEAVPDAGRLMLRMESEDCARLLLDLLPFRDRRGTWRGVRDLRIEAAGRGLRFSSPLSRDAGWRGDPQVTVRGPHGVDLTELLQKHRARLETAGCRPQWDLHVPQPVKRRRQPVEREVLEQHSAACHLASALLRRPRFWNAMGGHCELKLSHALTDYGMDWTVERSVSAGTSLHDDRLVAALTDRVVGLGLRVLKHECAPEFCTVQVVSEADFHGWAGMVIVQTRTATESAGAGCSSRPLLALGEPLPPSHPRRIRVPKSPEAPRNGRVIALVSREHALNSIDSSELEAVSMQIAAVWAAAGQRAAVLTVGRERPARILFGRAHLPRWATHRVPRAQPQWSRLRIDPGPGQLWGGSINAEAESITEGLERARRLFDRVLIVDGRRTPGLLHIAPSAPDAFVLALNDSDYERKVPRPVGNRQADPAPSVPLTPALSAVKWSERELGGASWHTIPLAGVLLLRDPREPEPAEDEFTTRVEEELARYGTPILGRFPRLHLVNSTPQSGVATVLDPVDADHRDLMTAHATALGDRLWPRPSNLPTTQVQEPSRG